MIHLTELETLEKLTEIVAHIERNNWEHLYEKADIEFSAKTYRLATDNGKLNISLRGLEKSTRDQQLEINRLNIENQSLRIKVGAIKETIKRADDEILNTNS